MTILTLFPVISNNPMVTIMELVMNLTIATFCGLLMLVPVVAIEAINKFLE